MSATKLDQPLATEVNSIRTFNRFYTRKIGALRERGFLSSEYSLTEVRVLYELDNSTSPLTATAIATTLQLDPGYLSRILRKFEDKKFISRIASTDDARQTIVTLTKSGKNEFAKLNSRQNDEVQAMIESVSTEDKAKLVRCMEQIKSILEPSDSSSKEPYVLRTHQPGDIGLIVQRHGVLYAREFGWDHTFEALVAEVGAKFLRDYDPKCERCWIAERDDKFLGTIMLVKHTDEIAKLRLFLVEPEARGMGIGKRLVKECINFARNCGYKKITLWTNKNLNAARAIYEKAGFKLVDEEMHHSFGHDLVGQNWELEL